MSKSSGDASTSLLSNLAASSNAQWIRIPGPGDPNLKSFKTAQNAMKELWEMFYPSSGDRANLSMLERTRALTLVGLVEDGFNGYLSPEAQAKFNKDVENMKEDLIRTISGGTVEEQEVPATGPEEQPQVEPVLKTKGQRIRRKSRKELSDS